MDSALPSLSRSLTPSSRQVLKRTKSGRVLSKDSAQVYLRVSVTSTQTPVKWKYVASPNLVGQLDRVLSQVNRFYSPKSKGGLRRVRDLTLGKELSRLLDLIHGNRSFQQKERSNRMVLTPLRSRFPGKVVFSPGRLRRKSIERL